MLFDQRAETLIFSFKRRVSSLKVGLLDFELPHPFLIGRKLVSRLLGEIRGLVREEGHALQVCVASASSRAWPSTFSVAIASAVSRLVRSLSKLLY